MANKNTEKRYPWAELYDVESGIKKINVGTPYDRPGRPRKPVTRIKTSITLTDEEKRMYEKLAYVLGSKMHPQKVTKGQVIGLALRLLDSNLDALPNKLDSWETLAAMVFTGEFPD